MNVIKQQKKSSQSLFSMLGTLIDLTSLFHKHKGYFFQRNENDRFGLYCINWTQVVVYVKERYNLRNYQQLLNKKMIDSKVPVTI